MRKDLEIIATIAEALNSAPDVQSALERTLAVIAEELNLDTGWVWLLDPETGHVYSAAARNLPPYLQEPVRMTGSSCWCIEQFREGSLESRNVDVMGCSRLRPAGNREELTRAIAHHATVPLYFQDKPLGILNITAPSMRRLSARELRLLTTIGFQLGVAIERARLAEDQATHARADERTRLARETSPASRATPCRCAPIRPGDPNAHDSLGLSYQWAGDYQKALAAYDDASRIDPGFEVAVVHRANTYWQMGRTRDAIRELRRYIELAPSPVDRRRGYGELSVIYRAVGDRARQAEATRQAARIEPSMYVDALAALDRGDVATAKWLVQSERKVEPGRGARSFRRHEHAIAAEVARAEGDRSAAIASAREAVRLLPPVYVTDDMEDVLGDILAAFAQWPEAIAEYGRVLRINPNRGRTRYKLARALESAGRVSEARSEYERFLQVWSEADSDAPELVDARARLSRIHSTAP